MDESQSLDALANLLNELAENPYDVNLHVKHIRLAQSLEHLQTQVLPAYEMFVTYLAAGEDVWLPLIDAKQTGLDSHSLSKEGLEEVLRLYDSAEQDYLCELPLSPCPWAAHAMDVKRSLFYKIISNFLFRCTSIFPPLKCSIPLWISVTCSQQIGRV